MIENKNRKWRNKPVRHSDTTEAMFEECHHNYDYFFFFFFGGTQFVVPCVKTEKENLIFPLICKDVCIYACVCLHMCLCASCLVFLYSFLVSYGSASSCWRRWRRRFSSSPSLRSLSEEFQSALEKCFFFFDFFLCRLEALSNSWSSDSDI